MKKIYPDSGVELTTFIAKHYDKIMNIASFGTYMAFIYNAIKDLHIHAKDFILDLGCGTGRNSKLMTTYLSKDGRITGLDLSAIMEKQFNMQFSENIQVEFIQQRIDQPFDLGKLYDKVFISFVLHGFPNEIRKIVIQNAYNHLKPGGIFNILDFAEFDMKKMPFHHKFIFRSFECKHAFDFIKKDWKKVLEMHSFTDFQEKFYFKNYIRLLRAVKVHDKQ